MVVRTRKVMLGIGPFATGPNVHPTVGTRDLFVGPLDLLESLLRIGIGRVHVRVKAFGETPVRSGDLFSGGVSAYTENLMRVPRIRRHQT